MITGISLPLKTRAITQYLGIEATGIAMLGGKKVITTATGVYVLDADSDDGTNINACVKTVKTDFGQHARKRVRTLFLRGRADRLGITLVADDSELELEYTGKAGFPQEAGSVQGQRSQSGNYWQFEFKNTHGGDFDIDGVDVLVNTLSIRRR